MTNKELLNAIKNMRPGNTPEIPLTSIEDSAKFILFLLDRGMSDQETDYLISGYGHLLFFSFDKNAATAQPDYYKFAEQFKFNSSLISIFILAKIPLELWADLLTEVIKYYRECATKNQGPDDKSATYQDLARRRSIRRRELRNQGYLQLDDPDLGN